MKKVAKNPTADTKVARGARTGDFLVAKPAVGPKRFTMKQIRAAVRKYNKSQAVKPA